MRKKIETRDYMHKESRVMYGTFAHVVPGVRASYYLVSTRNVWKTVTELLFQCLRLVFGIKSQEFEGTL